MSEGQCQAVEPWATGEVLEKLCETHPAHEDVFSLIAVMRWTITPADGSQLDRAARWLGLSRAELDDGVEAGERKLERATRCRCRMPFNQI